MERGSTPCIPTPASEEVTGVNPRPHGSLRDFGAPLEEAEVDELERGSLTAPESSTRQAAKRGCGLRQSHTRKELNPGKLPWNPSTSAFSFDTGRGALSFGAAKESGGRRSLAESKVFQKSYTSVTASGIRSKRTKLSPAVTYMSRLARGISSSSTGRRSSPMVGFTTSLPK